MAKGVEETNSSLRERRQKWRRDVAADVVELIKAVNHHVEEKESRVVPGMQ
jgi:hypothetical protein